MVINFTNDIMMMMILITDSYVGATRASLPVHYYNHVAVVTT